MDIFQKITDNGWIKISERLPEGSEEVLVYHHESEFDIHQVDIVTYFTKGDVMGIEPASSLLDIMKYGGIEIKAPSDGFYIFDCVDGSGNSSYRRHNNTITHWQSLPGYPAAL